MKRIVMKTKNNDVKVEAFGFSDRGCDKATEFLRRNLGDEIATELKPTYYVDVNSEEEDKICYKPLCG